MTENQSDQAQEGSVFLPTALTPTPPENTEDVVWEGVEITPGDIPPPPPQLTPEALATEFGLPPSPDGSYEVRFAELRDQSAALLNENAALRDEVAALRQQIKAAETVPEDEG